MPITYTAPNRSHHYHYAQALHQAGALECFVSGFPRWSRFAPLPELGVRLRRRDAVQLAYLAASRIGARRIAPVLAHLSKCHLDRSSLAPARNSSVFLAYNGCGLGTMRALRGSPTVRVIEVVNSHVEHQEQLLKEEYARCGAGYTPVYAPELKRRLAEYEEADYILCPSEFVRRSFLARGFAPGKILKNIYGVSPPCEPARPAATAKPRSLRILFVGTISIRKGVRYLVEAFRKVRVPGKELWLVGPPSAPTGLENILLPEGVSFRGVLKGEALRAAYQGADIFVLPSVEEGMALVMGEAMGNGLPVIATTNTGADDLYTDGVEGFIVPAGNADMLADKIQCLADDILLRTRMRAVALSRARVLGGWEVSGAALVKTLTQLSGNR